MTSTPCWQKCWSAWGHHPNEVPVNWPWHWLWSSCTAGRNLHGTGSVTVPRSFFSLGPQPHAPKDRFFCVSSLFDVEQVVRLHHHLVQLKGVIVLIESKFPLCFDNSIIAPPHSPHTFANLCYLGHLSKPQLMSLQEVHTLLWNFLQADLTAPSSASEQMRPSSVTDSWLESEVLIHDLLSELNFSMPWSVLSPLMSLVESLSPSLVLLRPLQPPYCQGQWHPWHD